MNFFIAQITHEKIEGSASGQTFVHLDEFGHGGAAIRINVEGRDAARAQQIRGEREYARTRANIQNGPFEFSFLGELLQEFHAKPRRLVSTGAEGQARIDGDGKAVQGQRSFIPQGPDEKA